MIEILWYCKNIYAYSGYSDEARVLINGLIAKGVGVSLIGSKKKKEQGKYKFVYRNNSNLPIVYHTYRHGDYEVEKNQYSIARTMLEVSRIPQSWVYKFNQMNEIWVPNNYNSDTFTNSGIEKKKLFVIPSPIDFTNADDDYNYELKTDKKFKFLTIFNYHSRERKGLDKLLTAYTRAFSELDDVCLVIKTNSSLEKIKKDYALSDRIPEVLVINEVFIRKNLLALYRSCDCFVLPSRGEGVGRPYLDAMMLAKPIIATGYGGHSDFLNNENAFLIEYDLQEVKKDFYLKYPGFYGSCWAEPDECDLEKKLLLVVNNHTLASKKARFAKQNCTNFKDDKICNLIINRFHNRLTYERSQAKRSLFERLFPLYYPDIKCLDEVTINNEDDFKRQIDSVIIFGQGHALQRAVGFTHGKMGIKKITILSEENSKKIIQSFPVFGFQHFHDDKISPKFEIFIIASPINKVAGYYQLIREKYTQKSIYIFF